MTWPIHWVVLPVLLVVAQMKTSRSETVRRSIQSVSVNAASISYVDEKEPGEVFNAWRRRSRYFCAEVWMLLVLETRKKVYVWGGVILIEKGCLI